MNINAMLNVMKCFVFVLGFLIFIIGRADSKNAGPQLIKTLTDAEQDIGENCFSQQPINCDPTYPYRKLNGECTNLDVPSRGMAGTLFTRLLNALYKDDYMVIRTQRDGKELNSARVLSNIFFTEPNENNRAIKSFDPVFTLSMMQWGQAITHDVSGTLGKQGPSCCTADNKRLKETTPNCVGIKVPTEDRFYSKFKHTCLNMPRSKNNEEINCNVRPILPVNFVTAYLDTSLLYGSTEEANKAIRLFKEGAMKFRDVNGNIYPPNVNKPALLCRIAQKDDICIQSGDNRANTHPMLTVLQIILLRLHNMLAKELFNLNQNWDDERTFQETRRIVNAMIQHISFSAYAPNLIGKDYLEKIKCSVKTSGYNNIYDKTINPQMMTEFSGCAFRYMHSTITEKVRMLDENRNVVSEWKFSDFFNSVNFISEGDNFDHLVRGMASEAQGNLDRHFPTSITDLLFQVNGVGLDMESIDIEKSRDQGINTYPKYLEMIGQPYPKSWDDYNAYMEPKMLERLKQRYDNYEDVELFFGGILEHRAQGSELGPVFQAIIAEQFCRLQKGDRFYYELGDQIYPFTQNQLDQIRNVTLSFIYCYTCKIKNMQPDAFRLISDNNKLKPCSDILKDFTLTPWKENKF